MFTNKSKIARYALAYAAWVIFFLLFLYFVVLSRETLLAYLRNFWIQDIPERKYTISLIDRTYIVVAGLIWVILIIVSETFFRNGVANGTVYHRTSLGVGMIITLIFLTQLARTLMVGIANQPAVLLVPLVLEFVLGAGLLYLSAKTPKKPQKVVRN